MHIVATNMCVWIRTLVRESLKEINEYRVTQGLNGEDYMILGMYMHKKEIGFLTESIKAENLNLRVINTNY